MQRPTPKPLIPWKLQPSILRKLQPSDPWDFWMDRPERQLACAADHLRQVSAAQAARQRRQRRHVDARGRRHPPQPRPQDGPPRGLVRQRHLREVSKFTVRI